MKITQQLDSWSEKIRSGYTDGLRIVLGFILFVKGYQFLFDMAGLEQTMQYDFGYSNILMVQALAAIHLFIGIFIIMGLSTRLACLVQIPIVTVAIFFNSKVSNDGSGELLLSIVTLFLLFFFLIHGNGKFSVYNYMINSKRSRLTDEAENEFKAS